MKVQVSFPGQMTSKLYTYNAPEDTQVGDWLEVEVIRHERVYVEKLDSAYDGPCKTPRKSGRR